jgi:hypothetical protein
MMRTFFLVALFLKLLSLTLFGQENLTSDELFAKARKAAFDEKDYPTAIKIAQQALEKSPDYTDISIFLGRV